MDLRLITFALLLLVSVVLTSGQLCPRRAASSTADIRPTIVFYHPKKHNDLTTTLDNRRQYKWNDKDLKNFVKQGFNLTQSTLIYTHGYTQSTADPWLAAMRTRYKQLKSPGFNLLFFDWSQESRKSYSTAASLVPNLGKALSQFLIQMNSTYGLNATNVHIVAYSLSPHIAAHTGRDLKSRAGLLLGQITAIDPTGVCFHDKSQFGQANMLRPSDAHLVVSRHYDMFGLGARQATGGVDIFVDGGKDQSTAWQRLRRNRRDAADEASQDNTTDEDDDLNLSVANAMSHFKAAQHESSRKTSDCHEVAYQCSSYRAFLGGACGSCGQDGTQCYYMSNLDAARQESRGNHLRLNDYKLNSNMYLKTSTGEFCLHHYQIMVSFESKPSSSLAKLFASGSVTFKLSSGQIAEPKFKVKGGKAYTQLITRKIKLDLDQKVEIQVTSSNLKALASSMKSLKVNFMSHPSESERQKESATYCPTTTTYQDSYLVKC